MIVGIAGLGLLQAFPLFPGVTCKIPHHRYECRVRMRQKEGCEFFSRQTSQSWAAGSVSPGYREMSTVNRSDPKNPQKGLD